MFKGLNRLRHDDTGFTVAEVVISAAILFFALTALVGLLGTTTSMTASAKSKSVLNDAITSEIDRIRAIPFARLAFSPAGDVEQTRVITREGFTITFTTTITDRTSSIGTKEVNIVGTAVREGYPTSKSMAYAAVRNRIGGTTAASGSVPTITFTSTTPRGDTIVVANKTASNDPLSIGVRANATGERTISRIEIVAGSSSGNVLLRDGTTIYANDAEQDYEGAPNNVETLSFTWHTGQVDQNGVKAIQDGRRVIRAIAYDDQGRPSVPKERTYIVDNFVPGLPGGVSLTGRAYADMTQDLSPTWTTPMDGTDVAPYVESEIREDTSGAADLASWALASQQQAPRVVAAQPFGRYVLRSRALSPLRNPSDWAVSSRVFTRPVISGTSDLTRNKFNNAKDRWTFVTRFSIPKPRYPWNSSAGVTVQVLENGVALASPTSANVVAAWNAGNNYAFTRTCTLDLGKQATPVAPTYQLRVVLTPTGYGAGAAQTITSNIVRPWAPADESDFSYVSPPSTISQVGLPLTATW